MIETKQKKKQTTTDKQFKHNRNNNKMIGSHSNSNNPEMMMSGWQTVGIVNAMKTGNLHVDMILAMLIPVVLKLIFQHIEKFDSKLRRWLRKLFYRVDTGLVVYHERTITHATAQGQHGGSYSLDKDSANSILIKAIEIYIHVKLKLDLRSADLDLTTLEDKQGMIAGYATNSNGSSSARTLTGMLRRYKIVRKPPKNVWHNLGRFGSVGDDKDKEGAAIVELQIEKKSGGGDPEDDNGGGGRRRGEGDNKGASSLTKFHLRSTTKGAVDDFVSTAYKWYFDKLAASEDNSRYYYDLQQDGDSSYEFGSRNRYSSSNGRLYSRFKLSDEKSFKSLFFPDKNTLLSLVNHFQKKSGKYGILGYPHKLGLLLHGPPGTGKTSIIKALAQYTGRSVVNVPVSKISTNSELMQIFFDGRYRVDGQGIPVRLGFKDVIFVMEDIDAASKVVRRRDGKKTADFVQTEPILLPPTKSLWQMFLESNDKNVRALVTKLTEKSERLREEATKPETIKAMVQRASALPHLSFAGQLDQGKTLTKVGKEALASASSLLQDYQAVDRFLAAYAVTIKAMIDLKQEEITDDLVDMLLGVSTDDASGSSGSLIHLPQPPAPEPITRETSYTKSDGGRDVLFNRGNPSALEGMSQNDKKKDKGGINSAALYSSSFYKEKDELNLSGILNVLDGVVDTPERIVIITTNHPEKLDPALIRPGRIDKKIMLGYMGPDDMVSLVQHYFQTDLSGPQKERVKDLLQGSPETRAPRLRLTPAQVEQLTAEYDTIDGMLDSLEKQANVTLATPFNHPSESEADDQQRSTITFGV